MYSDPNSVNYFVADIGVTRKVLGKSCFSLVACGALVLPVASAGGELGGTATVTSEYVYRGQALSDGNPALQGGVDYEHDSGLFVGAWASTIDLENAGGRRDVELVWYAGYHYTPDAPVDLVFTVMRHTYPGQSTYFDYDYTEALLNATFLERWSFEVGFSNDIYGWDSDGRHYEARGNWPLPNAWVVSAGLGYNDLEDQGTSDHWYWDLGASARFGWLTVDARWYDNETPTGTLAYLSAGSQFVLSLSTGF